MFIKRKAKQTVFVPFDQYDEEREQLINRIVENGAEVSRVEIRIDSLKNAVKPYREELEEATDKLVKGKPVEIAVNAFYDFDNKIVKFQRLDTSEIILERQVYPSEYQTEHDDEEVESIG